MTATGGAQSRKLLKKRKKSAVKADARVYLLSPWTSHRAADPTLLELLELLERVGRLVRN